MPEKKIKKSSNKDKPWLFQKGQSGNPKGRPKKERTFTHLLEQELEMMKKQLKLKDGSVTEVDGKQLLCKLLVQIAFDTDNDADTKMKAIDRIMDRIDGRPMQQVEMNAQVENNSVFDEIDVSHLNTEEKKNLENILIKMEK